MIRILRHLIRELLNDFGRNQIMYSLVRNCPGESGFALRHWVMRKRFKKIGQDVRIHEGVRLRNAHKIELGNRVTLGVENFIQAGGGVEIGDDSVLGPGVKVWTQNHAFADPNTPIRDQGADYRKVVIGKDVWIGANAFIMPGAEIGDGAVISAAAVVGGKKIPPYSILAGNPARVIGSRAQRG